MPMRTSTSSKSGISAWLAIAIAVGASPQNAKLLRAGKDTFAGRTNDVSSCVRYSTNSVNVCPLKRKVVRTVPREGFAVDDPEDTMDKFRRW